MDHLSRRRFLELSGISAAANLLSMDTRALPVPNHDLLIRGGLVIDPSQQLRTKRDIAVSGGRIVDLKSKLPAKAAKQVLDATGKLVVPGLIDLHAHVAYESNPLGVPVDDLALFTGVTTCVSAGDVGHTNFDHFRRTSINQLRTRVFAFLHISKIGLTQYPSPEMVEIANAEIELAAEKVARNRDLILGIKVRVGRAIVGENGLEPLRRAIAVAERSGGQARVMCHIGDAPDDLTKLLDLLRSGDILTHVYSGAGNNIVQNGKVLPAALAAKARGVIFDVGHGGGSFDYTIAEPAMAQGLKPDTISSDLHTVSMKTPGKPYLPWVMSKFLNLGFSLEEVIAMTTINPARVIGRVEGMGTLKVGSTADITILEVVEQPCSFVDTRDHTRQGKRFIRPVAIVRAGQLFLRPPTTVLPYPS